MFIRIANLVIMEKSPYKSFYRFMMLSLVFFFMKGFVYAQDSSKIRLKSFKVNSEEVLPFFPEMDTVVWRPSKKNWKAKEMGLPIPNDEEILINTISHYTGPIQPSFQLLGDTLFLMTSKTMEKVPPDKRVYRSMRFSFKNFNKKNKVIYFNDEQVFPRIHPKKNSFKVDRVSKRMKKLTNEKEDEFYYSIIVELTMSYYEKEILNRSIIRLFEEGILTSWHQFEFNGETIIQKYYNANNQLIREIIYGPDLAIGEKYDSEYTSEGKIKMEKFLFRDTAVGVYKMEYYESGTIRKRYEYQEGKVIVFRYFSNGNLDFQGTADDEEFLSYFKRSRGQLVRVRFFGKGTRSNNCIGSMVKFKGEYWNEEHTQSKKGIEEICSMDLL